MKQLAYHYYLRMYILLPLLLLLTACNKGEQSLTGYIDGEYTYISSGASGTLQQLKVQRGQLVKKGELLYELDPEPEASSVKAAQANIGNLEAQVNFSKLQLERQQNLFNENATSKMELERAQASYDSVVQELASTKATLVELQWSLGQKSVTAPVDGRIFDTFYQEGEQIPMYRPALALLAPENIQVIFFLPEEQRSLLKVGQPITFGCDSCDGQTPAKVSYISPEAQYTPPLIYSKDTREKLVFLTRARMKPEVAKNFLPGQPIDVYVNHE